MDLNLQIRQSTIIVCNLLVATMLLILSVPWSVYPDPHSQPEEMMWQLYGIQVK